MRFDEYILWTLLETHEHYETLNKSELDPKTLQQMGDKDMIKNRLTLIFKTDSTTCSNRKC